MCISKSGSLTCDIYNCMRFDRSLIDQFVNNITHHSMYKFKFQLGGGYITIEGGHRVGICGTTDYDNGIIKGFTNVCSINIRLCNDDVYYNNNIMSRLHNGSTIYNTCVVSPPKYGKTTFAKNFITYISKTMPHTHICVCDERGELCGNMYDYNRVIGLNTSVINDCSKLKSAEVFVRCMSPDVIVFDEVWSEQDIEAVAYAANAGVSVLFTIHGKDFDSAASKKGFDKIIHYLKRVVVLGKCNGKANIVELREQGICI